MPFLTVVLWAFRGKLRPHAVSCFLFSCPSSYGVSAFPPPTYSAPVQPQDQMLPEANHMIQCGYCQAPAPSLLKRLWSRQCLFPDDSVDMRLQGCSYQESCESTEVLQIASMFLATSLTISEMLHLHFWLVCLVGSTFYLICPTAFL